MSDDDEDDPTPVRRPRSHWGDAERAAVGRTRRTPPRGVSIPDVMPEDRDNFTPVTHILDTIPDPEMRRAVRLIWEHTANVEMRSKERVPDELSVQAFRGELVDMREQHLEFKTDLVGADGADGKIGVLRSTVDKLLHRAWWLFTVAVGAVGAAAIKLVLVGRAYGDLETDLAATKDRVQLLETSLFVQHRLGPALLTPGKETP